MSSRAIFFPIEDRGNLPQVSACEPCNREKSQPERYLLSVLPFGGDIRHPARSSRAKVPLRPEKNRKLHVELSEGKREVVMQTQHGVRESFTLPFDSERLGRLFEFVAKGLVHHHWQLRVPTDHFVGAGFLSIEGERLAATP